MLVGSWPMALALFCCIVFLTLAKVTTITEPYLTVP